MFRNSIGANNEKISDSYHYELMLTFTDYMRHFIDLTW